MLELYLSECRRFRGPAIAPGLIHAGALLFFDRVVDPLQQPAAIYELLAAIYAVVGALLGLYQAGSYARINQWIALLHRPIAPRHILIAVAGGGATMLAAAILIPIALMLATHGLSGARFVDARHWLLGLSAPIIALSGFLAGQYAMLAPRRYGWLALIPALLPTKSAAAGGAALLVQAMVLVLLAGLLASAFKPDLASPPRRPVGLAGTALAAAMGAYLFALVAGELVFQTMWIATGTHPLNSTPPAGGVVEATRAEGHALFEAGLAGRTDTQGLIWREQARMSEIFPLPPVQARLPMRGELKNMAPMRFEDARRGIRWTFSHDDMRFHGARLADGRRMGILGVDGGAGAFAAPPLAIDAGTMIAADGVYLFDADRGALFRRIRQPAGETVAAPPMPVGEAVAVLGDRALRFYDRRVMDDGDALRPAIATMPLPAPIGNLTRVDMFELLDGYLVSLTYARDGVDGPAASWQQIVRVDDGGRNATVARRALSPDFPLLQRFAAWWLSPVLRGAREMAEGLLGEPAPLSRKLPISVPPAIWGLAASLSLVAALGAAWLARRQGLGMRRGAAWTFAALALGLPMLLAFWLIRPTVRD